MGKQAIQRGSNNVFADIGLPNPEEHKTKADLAIIIRRLIKEQGLTQDEAAQYMGLKQSDVSNIVRGVLSGFSIDRLLRCINALHQDVTIVIKPARDAERPQVGVLYA
ncbi:MAG TPA: helix-turn-helix transcriptional regulator [Armatimonadota bacterium]|nr:helix-turn-helix transcriptional regulator [Armatimonadota bacterium]